MRRRSRSWYAMLHLIEPDGGDNRDVGRGSVREVFTDGPLLRSISPSPARCSHSRVCVRPYLFDALGFTRAGAGSAITCRRWEVWSDTSPAAGYRSLGQAPGCLAGHGVVSGGTGDHDYGRSGGWRGLVYPLSSSLDMAVVTTYWPWPTPGRVPCAGHGKAVTAVNMFGIGGAAASIRPVW